MHDKSCWPLATGQAHCPVVAGVTAYGGARSVKLIECSITNTSKEGVLAEGTYENAATVAQHGVINKRLSKFRDGATRQVTEAADAWGKQHGVPLDVEVSPENTDRKHAQLNTLHYRV